MYLRALCGKFIQETVFSLKACLIRKSLQSISKYMQYSSAPSLERTCLIRSLVSLAVTKKPPTILVSIKIFYVHRKYLCKYIFLCRQVGLEIIFFTFCGLWNGLQESLRLHMKYFFSFLPL